MKEKTPDEAAAVKMIKAPVRTIARHGEHHVLVVGWLLVVALFFGWGDSCGNFFVGSHISGGRCFMLFFCFYERNDDVMMTIVHPIDDSNIG